MSLASPEPSSPVNPSRIFIDRPVATSLLMIAMLLVGLGAWRFLPISALPEVDYPTIQVQTFYPGASPEVMTSAVTAPLERQFGQMSGLAQMMSQSSAGASVITLRFNLELGLDVAEQEVQAAINAAGNLLPSDLPAPPIYSKVNPADAPILTLGVASDSIKLTDVEDLLESRLVPKLSQIAGVGLVSISGGHRPAVRIQANPLALAAYGVSLDDLRTTIANLNVNTPKGAFDGPAQSSTINANDQIHDPKDYLKSVVAYRNGAPIRLSDVATVEIGPENSRLAAWMNTTPALVVNIQRQPGANVIQVVDAIKAVLPSLSESLPAGISIKPLTDRTTTIRASVRDVGFELSLSIGLVVLVIFLFLRNVPATIIPSLSVPLSLIGALAIMYEFGFSLDNLSLMALTVATGFVVDDAIVVIENIARRLEKGETPYDAAVKGSAQIGFTIISLDGVTARCADSTSVHGRRRRPALPRIRDHAGRDDRHFSLCVADPRADDVRETAAPRLEVKEASGGRLFQALTRFYAWTLTFVLDHQGVTLLVALATFVLTGYLYATIPKGFFPVQDTGLIEGVTQAAQDISFEQMSARQQALAKVILADPDVESLSSFIGVDGSNGTLNSGRFLVNLKPHEARKTTAGEIIRRIQREASEIAGIALYMQAAQDLSIDTAVSATQYQFTLENQDLATLQQWTPKVLAQLGRISSIVDVASDLQPNGRSVFCRSRPRAGGEVRRHARHRRQHALRRLRPANYFDDLYANQPVPGYFKHRSKDDAFAQIARFALSADLRLDDRTDAFERHSQFRGQAIASFDLASEAVSSDDDFVQPRARSIARRSGQTDRRGDGRDWSAADFCGRLSGRRAGVPGRSDQRSLPAARRDRGDVYRARRALRKLRPSDHDPHHPALGRRRRAAGA